MQKEVIPEQDPEGSFWTYEGGKNRRLEEMLRRVVSYFMHFAKYYYEYQSIEDVVVEESGTNGRKVKCVEGFGGEI